MARKEQTIKNKPISSLWLLLIGGMLLIPLLLFSTQTLDRVVWIRLEAGQIILLLISVLSIVFRKKLQAQGVVNLLTVTIVGYCVYSIVPLLLTTNFADGRIDWLKTALLCLLPPLLAVFWQTAIDKALQNIVRVLLCFGVVACGLGFVQLMSVLAQGGVTHAKLYEVFSLFAHKNLFSEVLLQILCFASLGLIILKKWWRILSGVVASVALMLIVVLMTRAVWVASVVSIAAGVFALLWSKQLSWQLAKKILLFAGIAAIIGAAGVIIYSKSGSSDAFVTQASQITSINYGTPKDRVELWKKSVAIINQAPVFGNGQGTWKLKIMAQNSKELLSSDNVTFYQQPHNDLVWVTSEQGYIGGILYLSIFLIALWFCLQIARNGASFTHRMAGVVLFAAVCGFFVASQFSFPRERIEHTVLLAIILSFIIALYPRKSIVSSKLSRYFALFFIVFTIVVATIGILWSSKRFDAEKQIKAMLDARAAQQPAQLIAIGQSIDSTVARLDPFTTPLAWYYGEAQFNTNQADQAFASFLMAWRINPWHVHVLNNLGTCYELRNEHDSALACYGRALAMSPHFNDALLNSAAIHFNYHRPDTAYSLIRQLDTTQQNERSNAFLKAIAGKIVEQMAVNETNKVFKQKLFEWSRDAYFVRHIHFKSLNEQRSLQKQITLDFIYGCDQKEIAIEKEELDELRKRVNN